MKAPEATVTVKVVLDTTEAEAKIASLQEAAQTPRAGITVKVVCPVCMTGIEYDHKESFAWGMASLTDWSEVDITAHDGGKIREHMLTHMEDGTWVAALRKRAEALTVQADRAEGLRKQ